jgi:hypothetical protein
MKNKLNLLSFLLPLFEMEMGDGGAGVGIATPDSAVVMAADSPSALESSSAIGNADAVNVEEVEAVETQAEVDPLKDVPTLEELEKQANDKVPHALALKNLRAAYEGVKPQLEQAKTYEPWKEIVSTINDPVQAKTAYDLIRAMRTPVEGQPNEFTSKPFIDRAEQEFGQGTANQLFHDLLTYTVPDDKGNVDTLVRHMYRSHGLNPDRIEDYRNIDTLRASGVVTPEDLSAIPDKYHDAFRALSQAQREDIHAQKMSDGTYPAATLDYLQDKAEALEARTWREKDEQARRETAERQQVEFQQQVAQAVEQDAETEVQSIYDSIHQHLSSQVTFSSDAAVNSLECDKILGVVANLQSPYPIYRNMAVRALKAVGVDVNGFGELAIQWEQERGKYVAFKASGQENTWDGRDALSKSNFAKQQILAKANDYALKLAKASGERAAAAASQTGSQIEAAAARFVPSGTGQSQQGTDNPYSKNPHPVGSQEYFAYNRQVDKQYNLTNASVFA